MSRCILVPFERYGCPKKCAQKVLETFFLNIFHIKTKWNIVYEYFKTKIFSRDTNVITQIHWTSNVFGHSARTIGVFWVSLNYPILNIKKTVYQKTSECGTVQYSGYRRVYLLTHFSPMSHFCTLWKRQNDGFLTFSEGIEMWHLTKMG